MRLGVDDGRTGMGSLADGDFVLISGMETVVCRDVEDIRLSCAVEC